MFFHSDISSLAWLGPRFPVCLANKRHAYQTEEDKKVKALQTGMHVGGKSSADCVKWKNKLESVMSCIVWCAVGYHGSVQADTH